MKIFKWVIIALFVLFLAFSVFGYLLIKKSAAPYEGQISVNNLNHTVEITFDEKGIPQIWARDEHDAFFTIGWLHASERLFQMDVTRRISQGRLSEILGEITLQFDVDSKIIGHRRMAQNQLDSLSRANRIILGSYTDGINAYVRQAEALPFEFYLLGYDFEPWTIGDCLSILSFQTWYTDDLQNPDKVFARIASIYGKEKTRSLLFSYPEHAPMTIPPQENSSTPADIKNQIALRLFAGNKLPFQMNKASNSWVVAPAKSASGYAMLASDPHLETIRIPQFWYYLGLHIREKNTDALGITAAGLPFIVMGHNGKTAWSLTASAVDITEYYEEQVNEHDSTQYLADGSWRNFEVIKDSIRVAGRDKAYPLLIKKTRHGPVFYTDDSLNKIYTLDWAGFDNDLDQAVTAGLGLAVIEDYDTFRHTVTRFGALSANWMYADKQGNIGYQLGTPVPRRPANHENLPVKGWENKRIWDGYLPLEKTPHISNPEKGWLASANNKPAAAENNINISGNFAADRIERLSQLLSSQEVFTVQDFMNMQMDYTDISLLHWVKKLQKPLMDFGPDGVAMAGKLAAWDGYCGIESSETAFIYIFIFTLKKNMLADEIGESYKKTKDSWLLQVLNNDTLSWYDDISTQDTKESRKDIIIKTLKETFATTRGKIWGDFQSFKMEHPFAVVPVLGRLLDLSYGPWPWGGTLGTPHQSFSFYNEGHFDVIIGASWRFIIDFANPDEIKMVIPAGNSGNPASPHFNDFLDLWLNGEYWTVPLSEKKVYSSAKRILNLNKQEEL